MTPFSFAPNKRKVWRVTLPDETVVTLKQPTLARYRRMQDVIQNQTDLTDLSFMIEFVAEVLSDNLEGHTVTAQDLEAGLTVSDLTDFVVQYQQFISEITSEKN